jgi:heme/copper-type cytochrome/quinol oxidase subunit 3
MLNNYFHDVATALLLASGITMWIVLKRLEDGNGRAVNEYFLRIYRGITGLAKFALGWILLGGIPRTLFYKDFEWANAAGRAQIPALIVKHILAFIFVGAGAYLWIRLSRKIKDMTGKEDD